jgi:hypothetical protein
MRLCKFFQVMWIISRFSVAAYALRFILGFAAPHFIIAYPRVIFFSLDVIVLLFRMWSWTFQYCDILNISWRHMIVLCVISPCWITNVWRHCVWTSASIFSGTDLSTPVCFLNCRAISSCVYLIQSRLRWSRYVLSTPRIKDVYLSTCCASSEDCRFSNPFRERLRLLFIDLLSNH